MRQLVQTSWDFSFHFWQFCGSGSVCFWASRIQIFLLSSKNSKKNHDSYCFVTSFWLFLFEKWCICTSKSNKQKIQNKNNFFSWRLEGHWRKLQDPDPLARGTDPRNRIRTKMSRIRNASFCGILTNLIPDLRPEWLIFCPWLLIPCPGILIWSYCHDFMTFLPCSAVLTWTEELLAFFHEYVSWTDVFLLTW